MESYDNVAAAAAGGCRMPCLHPAVLPLLVVLLLVVLSLLTWCPKGADRTVANGSLLTCVWTMMGCRAGDKTCIFAYVVLNCRHGPSTSAVQL
jgi:hypothetical protein